jgi:hypothetical protein
MDFMDAFILSSSALETLMGLDEQSKAKAQAEEDDKELKAENHRINKAAEKISAGGTI